MTMTKCNELFTFNHATLMDLAQKLHPAYMAAKPFPHCAIDNFLPEPAVDSVLDEFPGVDQDNWTAYERPAETKRVIKDVSQIGPYTQHLIGQFRASSFVRFLQNLTGIDGIISDPHLLGAGLHRVERGGFLKLHADFNWHPELKLSRRVNVLLYLNRDWQEEYGGHLELWDRKITHCMQRVLPAFNRLAIFSTTSVSWHGHPDPLMCPEGWARKAINIYYYSNGRPKEEQRAPHSTIFVPRPGEKFFKRGEQFSGNAKRAVKDLAHRVSIKP